MAIFNSYGWKITIFYGTMRNIDFFRMEVLIGTSSNLGFSSHVWGQKRGYFVYFATKKMVFCIFCDQWSMPFCPGILRLDVCCFLNIALKNVKQWLFNQRHWLLFIACCCLFLTLPAVFDHLALSWFWVKSGQKFEVRTGVISPVLGICGDGDHHEAKLGCPLVS